MNINLEDDIDFSLSNSIFVTFNYSYFYNYKDNYNEPPIKLDSALIDQDNEDQINIKINKNLYAGHDNVYIIYAKNPSQQLLINKLKFDARLIKYIDPKFLTVELYNLGVKKNGSILQYIPNEMINYNLCYNAVLSKFYTIKYVPIKLITKHLVDLVIEKYINYLDPRSGCPNDVFFIGNTGNIDYSDYDGESILQYIPTIFH